MMKILFLMEHDNKVLNSTNYHTLTAAQALGGEIEVVIIGFRCEAVVHAAQRLPGIKKIFVADAKEYAHQLAENSAELIARLAREYHFVLTSASTFGKNCLPRAAALLDKAPVTDVVNIISTDTFERYSYAGNALERLSTKETIKLLTIRTTAFAAALPVANQTVAVEKIDTIIPNTLSQFISQTLTPAVRPELTTARIIVAGGRGLKTAENFKLIEKLADRLGAAVGASRAAVDAGFASNDCQVGQTGKIVAPDLYIAIGISGAIQHLAGMKDSKVIVAINEDPDAPIFSVADYGLVADLFNVLMEIENSKDIACN
ncbi:MAG: etfA [Gammaproteobacteria bacterium]|jgi:electron transfer flavoprotein alpha subunit|nr:etfA [Gammaproteobacteria bacterium]